MNADEHHHHHHHHNGGSENEHNHQHIAQLRAALALNRQYRMTLMTQLETVERKQKQNTALQRKVRMYLAQAAVGKQSRVFGDDDQQTTAEGQVQSGKRYVSILHKKPASTHFFVDPRDGSTPPPNLDALRRMPHQQKLPLVFRHKKWTLHETNNLRIGIRQQNQERMIAKALQEYQRDKVQLKQTQDSGAMPGQLVEEREQHLISQLQQDFARITGLSKEELESDTIQINWEKLSHQYVPSRTAYECRKQWENEISVSSRPWTKEEDKLLIALAQRHQGHNWEEIAQHFPEDRNALQCFKRYQRSLNTRMMRSKWTDEEDESLTEAVKMFGEKNWQQVANYLEGRTGQQCLHRWMKTLSPDIRRGRWGIDEDKRLLMACHAYERNQWIRIQKHIKGRTDAQSRERWCNILNPELNSGPWTEEEDELLIRATEEHGVGKWSKIADVLYPRTDNQCWRRWKILTGRDEVKSYKERIKKEYTGIMRNFVGREKERPSLTADDFVIRANTTEGESNNADTSQSQGESATTTDSASSSSATSANMSSPLLTEGGLEMVDQIRLELEPPPNDIYPRKKRWPSEAGRDSKKRKRTGEEEEEEEPQDDEEESEEDSEYHDQLLLAEIERLTKIKELQQDNPMFIGVRGAPLVNSSISMLKNLIMYRPSPTDSQDEQQQQPTLQHPLIIFPRDSPMTTLPSMPVSRVATHALSNLCALLYHRDISQLCHLSLNGPTEVDPHKQLSLEEMDRLLGDAEEMSCALQPQSREQSMESPSSLEQRELASPSTPFVEAGAARSVSPGSQVERNIPSLYDVNELKHIDMGVLESSQFKALASVFDALFARSLSKMMKSTLHHLPHLVQRTSPGAKVGALQIMHELQCERLRELRHLHDVKLRQIEEEENEGEKRRMQSLNEDHASDRGGEIDTEEAPQQRSGYNLRKRRRSERIKRLLEKERSGGEE